MKLPRPFHPKPKFLDETVTRNLSVIRHPHRWYITHWFLALPAHEVFTVWTLDASRSHPTSFIDETRTTFVLCRNEIRLLN